MVRRPSGVTSWVARVQNGLLSNQPSQETDLSLADITDLLRPDLGGGQTPGKAIVERSNSSPSIGGEVGQGGSTRIELDLAGGGRRARCGTIAEQNPGLEQPQSAHPPQNSLDLLPCSF